MFKDNLAFLIQRFFSPRAGHQFWLIADIHMVSSLTRPTLEDAEGIYTVHNQVQLKDTIVELPQGHGLYDPINDAYILQNQFLWDFDENQDPERYYIPMIKVSD